MNETCPSCDHENPVTALTCRKCGEPTRAHCQHCNHYWPARHKFCGYCGNRIQVPDASGENSQPNALRDVAQHPERRQVTVLFCDLVRSTELATRLDPEDWKEVLLTYREACSRAIKPFGGYVTHYEGDGLLVLFGYPRAHEDAPTRAVRAALEIVREINILSHQTQPRLDRSLSVHIGIHTGLVVAGDMVSDSTHERVAVVGKTTNLAKRLQDLASPNEICISRETRYLVRNRFCVAPKIINGQEGCSVGEAYVVIAPKKIADSIESETKPEGIRARLVGRHEELALLARTWRNACTQTGAVVTIEGQAGIGKTRLLQALAKQIEPEDKFLYQTHCTPYTTESALFPIIELVRRQFLIAPTDATDEIEKKLRTTEAALELSSGAVALLVSLLNVETGQSLVGETLSPQAKRDRTIQILFDVLEKQARIHPILLAIEDIHWADASTIDLLSRLFDQIRTIRALVVLTYRSDFRPPWGAEKVTEHLVLDGLSRAHSLELITDLARVQDLSANLVDQIALRGDGVPLFLEELTKAVLEAEQYASDEPRTPEQRLAEIPPTLRDLLSARLDRLGAARTTAQTAAAIGRRFSYGVLLAISDRSETQLQEELDQLVRSEFLHRDGDPPKASYEFRHSLIQDAAYASLLYSQRRAHHRRIADALASRPLGTIESPPELLAHHYAAAGNSKDAIRYWRIAGTRAIHRFANVEASSHLGSALEQLGRLPQDKDRDLEELHLQIELGAALTATKGYGSSEVERVYARAYELSGAIGHSPNLFEALRGLQSFYQVRGPLRASRDLATRLVAIAQEHARDVMVVEAKRRLGWCLFCQGELASGRALLEDALRAYERSKSLEHCSTYGSDPAVIANANLAWLEWFRGSTELAVFRSQAAIDLGRELQHSLSLAYALCMSAAMYQGMGELGKVRELAAETIKVSDRNAFNYWGAWGMILEGWAIGMEGAFDPGLSRLIEGLDAYRATGAELFRPHALLLASQLLANAGRLGQATKYLEEANASANQNDVHFVLPEVLLRRGRICFASGDQAMAAHFYREAICLSRKQGAATIEMRAAQSLRALGGLNREHGSICLEI